MRSARIWSWAAVSVLAATLLISAAVPANAASRAGSPEGAMTLFNKDAPLLAYYYIWFDPRSWNRAKTDFPSLGRYSSDDKLVMLQHIRWAKAAGIDGFIVSWKNTDVLNRRLSLLIELADQENFKLVLIYEGLDVNRDPVPAEWVARDLDYFIDNFASDPAFDLFDRPVVIWSGTWEFTRNAISGVTPSRRNKLYLLASEKNPGAYLHLADLFDGDAYYWSSVNPDTYPGYPEKLQAMAKAVHDNGGLWIAPAAPGFDARLIGGKRIVERKDGATLRRQLDVAAASSPDAIGLISWNEFSENSYVEPSCTYGAQYLGVIASVRNGVAPAAVDECDADIVDAGVAVFTEDASPVAGTTDSSQPNSDGNSSSNQSDFDSSSPGTVDVGINTGILSLGALACLTIFSMIVIARRSRRHEAVH
jgi:Glycosyl hydrolase family 71